MSQPLAAYQVIGDPQHAGPFVFTCEHASNALPVGWATNDKDRAFLADHWGWDIGAADVTRRLVDLTDSCAVLAGFSRLACDANRRTDSPTYIVSEIAGDPVSFNRALSQADVAWRTQHLFEPYHAAIDALVAARVAVGPPVHLVSIHSYTPLYLGTPRTMEVGVLFDDFDEDAWHLEGALAEQGFVSALNAPYSGRPPDGLIYSIKRHGMNHGLKYIEFEIRNDLIDTFAKASTVAERIAVALDVFRPAR